SALLLAELGPAVMADDSCEAAFAVATPTGPRKYYRTRYYDPKIGRFLSEDPVRWLQGTNFYPYVRNGPTNLVDPTGLQALTFQDVKNIVHGHNVSGLNDNVIICLIWKE